MAAVNDVLSLAASGMRAQSARMRVIAENVANAGVTAQEPGGDPYRRKIPVFQAELDRVTGLTEARMTKVTPDRSDFSLRYEPGHPAADEKGYVKYSNVSTLVELMDMRAAQRAYEANLNIVEMGRSMTTRALDLLRR